MAINFEAANMAGYNNPKIEVFSAIAGENNTLTGAPSKSALLDCINRGSLPFFVLTLSSNQTCILPLASAISDGNTYSLLFSCIAAFATNQPVFIGVIYTFTDNFPTYAVVPVPLA